MPTILLVEDHPDLGLHEAGMLERAGHRVLRCSGAPTPLAACPMLRTGSCALPDAADAILFSCALFTSTRGRTYRGEHLLRAYRAHPVYGATPMIAVSLGIPDDLGGSGRLILVPKFAGPEAVLAAVAEALSDRPPTAEGGPHDMGPSGTWHGLETRPSSPSTETTQGGRR